MPADWQRSQDLMARARAVMPGGVTSNFRDWGENTFPIVRGQGAHVWDADGKMYIDYQLGFGPVILGHGYEPVVRRVSEAIAAGTAFPHPTPWEVQVAERIVRMCGVDLVRFANSGTEATMHALRIARAYTGREKVLKFEGQYHGVHDYLLFSTASTPVRVLGHRRSPVPVVVGSGIPRAIHGLILCLPFNDFELLEKTLRQHWPDLAAIIVEPILGNAGSIMPQPGYLELLRRLCDEYGIVLIFDEVKTGFRLAVGGAQQHFGIRADLVTYAKAMGNGFPVAAVAGKREVMEVIVRGQTAHAGTYCGNIVGMAAADATLEALENGTVLAAIAQRGRRLQEGLSRILAAAGLPHVISGPPAMFGILLTDQEEPRDFRDFARAKEKLYTRIMMHLIANGAISDPDDREPWFLCYSHSEEDIDNTLNYFADAVKEALAER
jgi:glutamate-1-semialdehyde 2,1-aminomutase